MNLKNFLTKKICILGLGKENLQFLRWLKEVVKMDLKQVCILDKKPIAWKTIQAQGYDLQASDFGQVYTGETYLSELNRLEAGIVVKAPGIHSLLPELVNFREQNGTDSVISSLTFFIQKFKTQIIGITGTKGKSTTSSWTSQILQKSGIENYYCGNTTGVSPYTYWTEIDQKVDLDTYYVLELSSFQLQDLGQTQTSPNYGLITNYYEDHQDQHNSLEEYWEAKNQLFRYSPSGQFWANEQIAEQVGYERIPEQVNLVNQERVRENQTKFRLPNPGFHNYQNLTLALSICTQIWQAKNLQISESKLDKIVFNLNSLPYRQEYFHTYEDEVALTIDFYDDGYATEPDAVAASINSLAQKETKLILIITGKIKTENLSPIILALLQNYSKIQRVLAFSKLGELLIQKIQKFSQKIQNQELTQEIPNSNSSSISTQAINQLLQKVSYQPSFDEFLTGLKIADLAKDLDLQAKSKYNLVFSPGGSSFDEFENATQRSEIYKNTIKHLAK